MFNLSTPRSDQKRIPSNSINEVNVNESDPRSNVHYLGSSENKAWKNSGLYGIWTHDLCDTGAVSTKF